MLYDTNELGKTPRMEDEFGPIARVPLCCGCEFREWISGQPATREDPPEPGGYDCVLCGFIDEGQEPIIECRAKEAAERSRAIAAHEEYLDAMERSREATIR